MREKKAEIFRNGLSVAVVHCQHPLVFVKMRTHYPAKIAPPVAKVALTDEQLLVHLRTCARNSKGSILAYDRFPERLRDITTQKYILMSKTLHACAFLKPKSIDQARSENARKRKLLLEKRLKELKVPRLSWIEYEQNKRGGVGH